MLVLSVGVSQATVVQCDPNNTGSAAYPNVACNSSGALVVSTSGGNAGTLTSSGGSVTTGGTAQQVFAANAARKYLIVQNTSTGNLYVAFGVTATAANGILLPANASYVMEDTYVSTQSVSILGATTGQTFSAWQGN